MSTDPPATGTVYGRGAATASSQELGLLERLHPAITAAIAAAVIGVSALGYMMWRSVSAAEPSAAAGPPTPGAAPPPAPSASPSPSPSPTGVTLSAGTWSLESADQSGSYVSRADGLAVIDPVDADSDAEDRREASLVVLAGLADSSCFTFRTADGRYLRHYDFRLRFDESDDSALFREDATFCAGTGSTADAVTLRSHNYPDRVIRHRQSKLWLDRPDGSEGFASASSFTVRSPLTS
ncbi:AbfB domain-containing protein [Micromonospora sp. CPCC 206061]|uniref:AbfB domain-containing protein n=1 Tax=Micromonospora sp. CPCC 206061 TaxID=3122410 RepID=UPI002FF188E1